MTKALFVVLCVAIAASSAGTQSNPQMERRALNNFSNEMTECAGYYMLASSGLKALNETRGAAKAEQIAGELLQRSTLLTKQETVLARLELSLRERSAIDDNYENMSILLVKYADLCKVVYENPEDRLTYWRQKMLKR